MLSRLYLKDFAIAAEVDFDLGAGLGVISGETGAGKSLLVDALMLLSGTRADAAMVRHGQARAELVAEFALEDCRPAQQWLQEAELDEQGQCQIRRVIRADGGSRAWINGRPATLGQLGELAERLIGIHGQHEHQALLDRQQQTELLDAFAGLAALRGQLSEAHRRWQAAEQALRALQGEGDPAARIEWLEHQLRELALCKLDPAHIAQVLADQRRLAAGAEILSGMGDALRYLNDEQSGGVRGGLRSAIQALARASEHETGLAEASALLDSAAIQLDEAAATIERLNDRFELDPAQLGQLEGEIGQWHELARKHRCTIESLQSRQQAMQSELDQLSQGHDRRERLQREVDSAVATWREVAAQLSAARAEAARRLQAAVIELMAELGMAGGVLQVELQPMPDPDRPNPLGAERVELCVSTNAGQPPRPLRKVASGGELARISLAIEVATLGADAIPTMVFDEVDSGIGGAIAEVVGQKLRALGRSRQVLCVTHLAQVAAQGHYQFRVSKGMLEGVTVSAIERLSARQRVDELARMIGGVEITPTTLAHAKQMLQRAQSAD